MVADDLSFAVEKRENGAKNRLGDMVYFCLFVVLGIDPEASPERDKHATTELHPQI